MKFSSVELGDELDPNHSLSKGVIGEWNFAEKAGTILHDIVGRQNGNILNTEYSDWKPSLLGFGIDFDGSNEKVELPTDYSDLITSKNKSICSWVTPQIATGAHRIFVLYRAVGSTQFSILQTGGKWALAYRDTVGGFQTLSGATTPTVGKLTCVCGVQEGTSIRLYVDGILDGSNTNAGVGTVSSPPDADIAVYDSSGGGSNNEMWQGEIHQCRLYDRTISPEEVLAYYIDPYQNYKSRLRSRVYIPPAAGINITVPQGDLIFSTTAPTLVQTANVSITIPQGDLTFSTTAPILALSDNIGITIPQADLSLSTTAPTINVTSGINITIPQADLIFSTSAPTLSQTANIGITIPQADLAFSTTAPTAVVSADIAIEIPGANLSLSTTAPLLDFGLTIPQADLMFSTTTPTVVQTNDINITVPQADLSFSTTAPSLVVTGAGINISIPSADLTFSTFAPILDFGYTIPQANLTFTGSAPSLDFGLTIPQADLVLDPKTPSIEIKTAWYDVSDETTTWSDVADESTVWTDVTDASTTWSN